MPTAKGFLKSHGSGSKFTATFPIEGIAYAYSANMSSSVEPFASSYVTLTFESEWQLVGTREYNGKVGTNDVKFTLANGPTIAGELDIPISSESTVNGSGTWMQR